MENNIFCYKILAVYGEDLPNNFRDKVEGILSKYIFAFNQQDNGTFLLYKTLDSFQENKNNFSDFDLVIGVFTTNFTKKEPSRENDFLISSYNKSCGAFFLLSEKHQFKPTKDFLSFMETCKNSKDIDFGNFSTSVDLSNLLVQIQCTSQALDGLSQARADNQSRGVRHGRIRNQSRQHGRRMR